MESLRPARPQLVLADIKAILLESEDERRRWPIWIAVIILALLCHWVASLYELDWRAPSAPLQVEINQVDPAKLDAIRKEWARQKNILIDKDKNRPSDQTKPKDARYFSDKNINVQKEQRATVTNVLPRPGAPGPMGESKPQERSQPVPKAENPVMPLPKLGNLGVPLNLNRPVQQRVKQDGQQQYEGNDGGDQAVLDRDLPQGSENMLNAEESVYYSFYARMYEAIAPIWQSRIREVAGSQRVAAGDYTTVVDVILDKEGNLVGVRRVRSSGVDAFDRAVDQALQKTARFPNPPKDLLNESGEVHTGWTFTVSLQQGTGYNFLPPERVY